MSDVLVVRNIGQLLTMTGPQWSDGTQPLGLVVDAALVVVDGLVQWAGPQAQLPPAWQQPGLPTLDVGGKVVLPGLVECHTHTLFGGDRAHEFELRCRGATYEEIAHAGGGILHTMSSTRRASAEELVQLGLERLQQFARFGVTTVETKSGYGLSLDSELMLLQAARQLAERSLLTVCSTLLAAHTVPPEFKNDREGYLDLICHQLLPRVQAEHLADFFDVFCEATAFTLAEAQRLFEAATNAGLPLKIHSEQLTRSGATLLGARMGCVSADHLEYIQEEEAEALSQSGTVAVLLPGATAFLGKTNFAPAHLLRQWQVPVAISTDFNPGSSHTQNLWMMGTLGSAYYRMTPAQSLHAMTATAAKALKLQETVGQLAPGFAADFAVTSQHNWHHLLYDFGSNPVEATYKRGRKIT